MNHKLSLRKFQKLELMLLTLRKLGLALDMTIVWEKKPQLTINMLGNFEFTNPQEVYGVVISFWADDFREVSSRFHISEEVDDGCS